MKITLNGHGPLQNDPKARVPWEDIYVEYPKPPRNSHYQENARHGRWSVVLIGRHDLRNDITFETELATDNPKMPGFRIREVTLREIDRLLDTFRTITEDEEVYCRERSITRKIAERMVGQMLEDRLPGKELDRLLPLSFCWVRSKTVIGPISLGDGKVKPRPGGAAGE